MNALGAAAALITLAALFGWLNYRTLRRPQSIALLLFSLAASLVLLALGALGFPARGIAQRALDAIPLGRALLDGMLSFLLFAGALHVDLAQLRERRGAVAFLASLGVVVSAFLAGTALWAIFRALGDPLPLAWCLVFGALISPTDPIAVMGFLKSCKAERSLEVKMAGESLFNDGTGVVLFVLLLGVAAGGEHTGPAEVARVFAREALGGALFGLAIGWGCYRLLASVDDYQVEILLTLALVMGGYAAALALHLSGPIAIVVAGILIGNHGRRHAMSERTRGRLDDFWELVDGILNAVLFVMIGLELLVIDFHGPYAWAALLAVPAVLAARFLSVSLAAIVPGLRADFPPQVVKILTWGGLRGGISVALALSLPAEGPRDPILAVTYAVVLFSVLVQGLTLPRLLRSA